MNHASAWRVGQVSVSDSKLAALRDEGKLLQNWVGLDKKKRNVKSAPSTPNAGRRALSRVRRSKSSQAKRRLRDPKRSWQPPPSARKRVQSVPASIRPCVSQPLPVSTVRGHGYIISRAKDAVEMKIDSNKFFTSRTKMATASEQVEGQPSRPEFIPIDKFNRITQESLVKEENLQREIVDLNIRLEDLKTSCNKDVNKAKEELSKEKKRIHQAHEKELRLLQQSYDKHLIQTEEHHKEKMKTLTDKMTMEADQLQEELEHSRKLLETTKNELEREKDKQIETLKASMTAAHKEQMDLVGTRLLKEQQEEFEQTMERVKKSHSQQLLAHEQQHQENIKAILERTGDMEEMERQFSQVQEDNKAMEEQLVQLKDELEQIKQEKTVMEAKLLEAQIEVDDFRNRFEARVRQVESQYIDQIDGLRLQNSQLRRKMLDQSVHISQYQSVVSTLKAQSRPSKSAMFKAVVQARMAANLSLAGDTALARHNSQQPLPYPNRKQPRPTSAPGTTRESEQVRVVAVAADQRKLGREQGQRPQSSFTVGRFVRV